jgi:hypothetical protein
VAAAACAARLADPEVGAAFAIGLTFLGEVRRTGAFLVDFFPTLLVFPTVLAFVPVAAFATRVFFRFALAVRLAFISSSHS